MDDGATRSSGATLALSWTIDGDHATVALEGELDTATSPELEHLVDGLADAAVQHVAIDLHDLAFLDSSGLRVLIRAQRRLTEELGGSLELRRPPAYAQRLLSVTGLDTYFAVR